MTAAHVGKTLTEVTKNLEKLFEEGANLGTNYSDAAYEQWRQNCAKVFHESGDSISEATRTEMKEKFVGIKVSAGIAAHHAEAAFDTMWNDVRKAAESIRKAAPAAGTAAGTLAAWMTGIGAASLVFFGALGVTTYVNKPDVGQQAADDAYRIRHAEREATEMNRIALDEAGFNTMTGALFVPLSHAPEATVPEPAVAAALPQALAPLAAAPVRIQLNTATGPTRTVTTTFADFYEKAPREVRDRIDQAPPTVAAKEPDNDNPVKDCLHTDCLGAIDKEFAGNGGHKDYTITNGDGSASISVSIRH